MFTIPILWFTNLAHKFVVWWRWLRCKSLPWWTFGLACWQVCWSGGESMARLRFAIALARLDHLGMVSLLNDCLW